MQFRELEIQHLQEEHRKKVAAAALEEIELTTKSSADGSDTGKLSELFTERDTVKSKTLVQDWSFHHRAVTLPMLQMNRVWTFLVPSRNQTKPLLFALLQLKL